MKRLDRIGLLAGLAACTALTASIYLGSRALEHFDCAVLWYAIGSELAAFAIGYRFTVWAQRPPSRMYFLRGAQLFFRRARGGRSLPALIMSWRDSLQSRMVWSRVPPHPGPLPKGEGESCSASGRVEASRFVRTQRTEFPLTEGKGQGENAPNSWFAPCALAPRLWEVDRPAPRTMQAAHPSLIARGAVDPAQEVPGEPPRFQNRALGPGTTGGWPKKTKKAKRAEFFVFFRFFRRWVVPGKGEGVAVGPEAASEPPTMIVARCLANNFVAQNFIRRRSLYRWIMHLCLSGGCTLAFAITFPLVFGWIHFESFAENAEIYRVAVFGFAVGSFEVHSATAFVAFNLLNFSAIIVIVGLIMAAARRLTNAGERATQKFTEDILPLLVIFAVTASGLLLAVSYKFLAGRGHSLVAVAHLISVLALLGYIPFGKLFHMFQRSCALCVSLYKKAGEASPRAHCLRCGEDFASAMHVADLKLVLDQLGFNYRWATPIGELHYQDICPACRRRLLALNQGRTLGR